MRSPPPDPLAFAGAELLELETSDLRRFLRTVESAQAPEVRIDGRTVLCLCSNNYLGLADDPRLARASARAAEALGAGAGASRLISGNMSLHDELERALATWKGAERALLFNSGYHANCGAIPALVGSRDLVLSDELNHASLIDGTRLSRATVRVFRHGDRADVARQLADRGAFRRAMIVTDTVFSMDGDLAPLPDLVALAREHEALLYVDEAHASGVLGEAGRGAVEHFGLADPRIIQMGTLGKALGSFGAFVASRGDVIELLLNRARSFVFTTGLPPAVVAAALAAVAVVRDEPERRRRLVALSSRLRDGLAALGFRVGGEPGVPIVPVLIGEAGATMELARALFERGVLASGIRPPTVPPGTSRIRATLMATMSDEQVDRAIDAFADAGRALGLIR
ncbi:MAG: 8-amino-7-oxononanoate synthase [Deltaproteobacteria bacterium]|jgi:8-amino-7-oxononanoate synthase|nr:8-amino-7-oxononanoate synthase [Deltaproteobacteria bacterium]